MINLLTENEQRKVIFVEMLATTPQPQKLSALAKHIGCSVRALQSDLEFFHKHFDSFTIHSSNAGVFLTFGTERNLEAFYQKMLADSTAYQLLELVFLYEGRSIEDLADQLTVSTATVYRLLHFINKETEAFDFWIETNPIRVVGQEEAIRYFFYQYFDEKYSFLEWPYDTIDEEALDQFLRFFINFTQMDADFAFYNIFKTVSTINLIRYIQGHYVSTDDISINFDEIIPDLKKYGEAFAGFEKQMNVEVSTDLIEQVFTPYIQDGFSLNMERLQAKVKLDKTLETTVNQLDTLLSEIAEKHDLPLQNKEEIIFALCNANHLEYQEPQSGYVLYNRNQVFADEIQTHFPEFFDDLQDAMVTYRQTVGKPLRQDGINFFMYTAFSFWENLVPELLIQFKQIRVVVISDRHVTHGHMIKDVVEQEFSGKLTVDIFSENILNDSILNQLDCDIILTTFPLETPTDKKVVYIENIPTRNDLTKLHDAVNGIIFEGMY